MLNDEKYEELKSALVISQRLFNKLNRVAVQAKELDYDESGLYEEEEETYMRHWLKLSSKVVDNISESLPEYNITLLKNALLEDTELIFNLSSEDETSKIRVDYSEDGSIGVTQLS